MVIPVTRIDKEREREAEYKKGGYPRGNLTIGEERKISFEKRGNRFSNAFPDGCEDRRWVVGTVSPVVNSLNVEFKAENPPITELAR